MKQTPVSGTSILKILGLLLCLMMAVPYPLNADSQKAEEIFHYQSLLSEAADPVAVIVPLIRDLLSSTGSSLLLEATMGSSVPVLVASEAWVTGTLSSDEPSVLVAVDLNHADDVAWSVSVWLSMLAETVAEGDSRSVAFSIIPPLGTEPSTVLEAGTAFWLATDPYQILAEQDPQAVILLDLLPDETVLSVEAETRGRLSPFYVLKALRSALGGLDITYSENVVEALYARAGLIDGSLGLMPWLELGVPAIRLHGQFKDRFHFLPAEVLRHLDALGEETSDLRDVNYLRYQLPSAIVSLDDVALTRVILVLLTIFMASVALRPLFTRTHTGGFGPGVLPEAMVAYLFSFIAVSLSWLFHGLAARIFGSGPLSISQPPFALAIGTSGRFGSSILFFFVLSGLSERLGLLPHAVRGTASQAAAMIAGVLGVSVLFFSIQGALILFFAMILLSLAGVNAAVAMLSISLLVVILFPLVFSAAPVFVPGLVTILNARGHQLLLLAGFTAPVALWILTTLSPRHRLVRGYRTAPYLVAVALILCFLDPWLRSRL
jgi:hypothetical protein